MPGLLLLWPAKALSPQQVTKGGAHATGAITSQATRGLVASGEAGATAAGMLAVLRGILATGSAEAIAAAAMIVVPLPFTRGMVSVRSGDAVMPGTAVPDPRWGNTGGPSR